jgi:hypothetical protein
MLAKNSLSCVRKEAGLTPGEQLVSAGECITQEERRARAERRAQCAERIVERVCGRETMRYTNTAEETIDRAGSLW